MAAVLTTPDHLPSARSSVCPQCGAPLEAHDKFCPRCGKPTEVAAVVHPEPGQKYFRCQNCGAEVAVDPNQRSYTCAFCDSTYVVEFDPATTGRQPPEFAIGFAVTPQDAQERFCRWLGKSSWFRPGDLCQKVSEKLRGVYLPFWSFSMRAESRWSAAIGEYWYRTETYTTVENGKTVTRTRTVRETEWWDLDGRRHDFHSGFLVSGSRGLPQQEAERIKPYRLEALKRYEPYFLAGWNCEEYSIAREEAQKVCQEEFCRREQASAAAELPGDTYSNLHVQTEFSDINSDLILLPVYVLSYRYGDKLYRFAMNGQTGKLSGQKPVSGWRLGIAIAVAVVLALLLILLFVLQR